jgi:2-oxoglutarate ferredoxin oxidoreductase subunit beta
MANIPQRIIHEYLRHDKKFPHVWCAGCSNGIV